MLGAGLRTSYELMGTLSATQADVIQSGMLLQSQILYAYNRRMFIPFQQPSKSRPVLPVFFDSVNLPFL